MLYSHVIELVQMFVSSVWCTVSLSYNDQARGCHRQTVAGWGALATPTQFYLLVNAPPPPGKMFHRPWDQTCIS